MAQKPTDVARSVYATVMAAGQSGVAASDLRALHPGVAGDPIEFVKQHAGLTIRKKQAGGEDRFFIEPTAAASD